MEVRSSFRLQTLIMVSSFFLLKIPFWCLVLEAKQISRRSGSSKRPSVTPLPPPWRLRHLLLSQLCACQLPEASLNQVRRMRPPLAASTPSPWQKGFVRRLRSCLAFFWVKPLDLSATPRVVSRQVSDAANIDGAAVRVQVDGACQVWSVRTS